MTETEIKAINADIARKCADDVKDIIRRNILLAADPHGMFLVTMHAAVVGLATLTGTVAAMDESKETGAEQVDALWHTYLRPMVLAACGDDTAFKDLVARAPS